MNQKPTKAYLIDPVAKTITEVEQTGLESMKRFIGGWLECACQWPSGDLLYVDEEGLLKTGQRFFFLWERRDQALAGRGLLVGRERVTNAHTGAYVTDPPAMRLEELAEQVSFEIG